MFDYYLVFLIGTIVLFFWSLIVQWNLKAKTKKGSTIQSTSGKTANEVVEEMLKSHEIYNIEICHKSGELTDCYSPKEEKIYLSDTTYGQTSLTAIAVAAHEAGHAVQDHENMILYEARQLLVPFANIGTRVAPYIVIIGAMLAAYMESGRGSGGIGWTISTIGIVMYALTFLFYLVMLPVERDASRRAYKDMKQFGWVGQDQVSYAFKILRAAGDTYAVALASSLLTLIRLLAIRGRSSNSRRR